MIGQAPHYGAVRIQHVILLSLAAVGTAGACTFADLELRVNRMTFELSYELERYAFPAAGGVVRHEQLAALMVRATWSPGKIN